MSATIYLQLEAFDSAGKVGVDLRPSMKVMIPSGKLVPRNGNPKRESVSEEQTAIPR